MSKPGSRAKKTSAAKSAQTESTPKAPEPSAAGPFELPADLRIGTAAATYAEILKRAGQTDLVIDGARVAKIDAAGVQALLAALLQFSRSGAGWRWHNPSTVLVQGVTVLGLGESLRLP